MSSSSSSSSGMVSTTIVKSEEISVVPGQDADHTAYLKLWGKRGTRNESFVEYVKRLPCILGRVKASENHVQIAGSDTSVSRKHATITWDTQKRTYSLTVFGKNGCTVSGRHYSKGCAPIPLKNGCPVKIGSSCFYVLYAIEKPDVRTIDMIVDAFRELHAEHRMDAVPVAQLLELIVAKYPFYRSKEREKDLKNNVRACMHHNSTLQGNLKLFEKVNEQVPRKGGGTKSALRYRMLRQDEQKAHIAMEGTHVKEEMADTRKDDADIGEGTEGATETTGGAEAKTTKRPMEKLPLGRQTGEETSEPPSKKVKAAAAIHHEGSAEQE